MLDYAQLPLTGKLATFDMRLATQALTADDAASMLAAVHADLEQPEGHQPADYEQYAQLVQSFREQMPDVYEQVVSNWQGRRPLALDEEEGAVAEESARQARAGGGPAGHSPGGQEVEGGEEEGGEGEEGEEQEEGEKEEGEKEEGEKEEGEKEEPEPEAEAEEAPEAPEAPEGPEAPEAPEAPDEMPPMEIDEGPGEPGEAPEGSG